MTTEFKRGDHVSHSTWKGSVGVVRNVGHYPDFYNVDWKKDGPGYSQILASNLRLLPIEAIDVVAAHSEHTGRLTVAEMDELRKHAVRGTASLVTGAYRYISVPGRSYEDIFVLGLNADGKTFKSHRIEGYPGSEYDRHLTDAGIVPRPGPRQRTCNLGHVHDMPDEYGVNFMVPLTLAPSLKV